MYYYIMDEEKSKKNWTKVNQYKEKIREILLEDAMGAILHSKEGGEAEEEKASLFFVNREHKCGERTNMLKLKVCRNNEEKIIDDKQEI